jgi:hypothetical protein
VHLSRPCWPTQDLGGGPIQARRCSQSHVQRQALLNLSEPWALSLGRENMASLTSSTEMASPSPQGRKPKRGWSLSWCPKGDEVLVDVLSTGRSSFDDFAKVFLYDRLLTIMACDPSIVMLESMNNFFLHVWLTRRLKKGVLVSPSLSKVTLELCISLALSRTARVTIFLLSFL